jgi:hypothetical protein
VASVGTLGSWLAHSPKTVIGKFCDLAYAAETTSVTKSETRVVFQRPHEELNCFPVHEQPSFNQL